MANGSYYQNLCNFVPMKRYFLIFLLLSASLYGKAQQEIPSALPGKEAGDTLPSYLKPVTTELRDSASTPRLTPEQARVLESLQVTLMMPSPFSVNEDYDRTAPTRVFTAPGFVGFTPWQNAVLHVSGASESLPGLMGIEQGTIGFSQTFGRLSLDAFASATHYGYFRGMQTSYGFGGRLVISAHRPSEPDGFRVILHQSPPSDPGHGRIHERVSLRRLRVIRHQRPLGYQRGCPDNALHRDQPLGNAAHRHALLQDQQKRCDQGRCRRNTLQYDPLKNRRLPPGKSDDRPSCRRSPPVAPRK